MENRELVIGGFYKHFKDKLYQVKCIAYHSESKEKMVVYQALYGDYSVYVRPYDMFMSEVDHVKYPEVTQKYRFEQVIPDSSSMPHVKAVHEAEVKEEQEDQEEQEENIDPRLQMFLDAESDQEKLNVLAALRDNLDEHILTIMGLAMDIQLPEGNVDAMYLSLKKCISTKMKYESVRHRV